MKSRNAPILKLAFLLCGLLSCGQVQCQADLNISDPGSIVVFSRRVAEKRYELTDHLGNVRSMISDIKLSSVNQAPANFNAIVKEASQYYAHGMLKPWWLTSESQNYQATLEDSEADKETLYFGPAYAQTAKVADNVFNHTDGAGANKSLRLNGSNQEVSGLAKSFPVKRGDSVELEVYAKYIEPSQNAQATQAFLQTFLALTTQFGVTPAIDGQPIEVFHDPLIANQLHSPQGNNGEVKGYLNYLLFDKNYTLLDAGYRCLTSAAKEDDSNGAHEKLSIEVPIDQAGYLLTYLSNESERISEVYFDDFRITHHTTALAGKENGYRFGFIGHEKDNEVKGDGNLIDFGQRIYDPRVGRFKSIDRYFKKYPSLTPYQYANNSPLKVIDLDGDLLKVVGEAKEITKFKAILEKGMENKINVNIDKEGLVTLKGNRSKLNDQDKVIYDVLSTVISESQTIHIGFLKEEDGSMGLFARRVLDLELGVEMVALDLYDVEKLPKSGFTAEADVIHEIWEAYQMEIFGKEYEEAHKESNKKQGAVDGVTVYDNFAFPNHQDGIGFTLIQTKDGKYQTIQYKIVGTNLTGESKTVEGWIVPADRKGRTKDISPPDPYKNRSSKNFGH